MDLFVLVMLNIAAFAAAYLVLVSRMRRELDVRGTLDRVRREVSALVVEINATTDRNVSLIEDRLQLLKTALDDADRRLGVIDRELARKKDERDVYSRLRRSVPSVHAQPEDRVGDSTRLERADTGDRLLADTGARDSQAATGQAGETAARSAAGDATVGGPISIAVPRGPEPGVPFVTFSTKPVEIAPSLRERVLDLRKRGFSNDLIAARVGTTIAEIDVIIGIEDRRGSSDHDS
ncbi:MAG: hypothetical protein NT080_13260 [Spirochaetes bacterium]|nr:hypothetical protein [Spirochaetota bacterium]